MTRIHLCRSQISELLRISDPYLLLDTFELDSSSSTEATTSSQLASVSHILASHFIDQPTLPASISQEIMLQSLACLINLSFANESSLAIIVAFNTKILLPVCRPLPSLNCRVNFKTIKANFIQGKASLIHDSSLIATSACTYTLKSNF